MDNLPGMGSEAFWDLDEASEEEEGFGAGHWVDTLENDWGDLTITVTVPFLASCPVPESPRPYGGTITLEYSPRELLVEFDTFGNWIGLLGDSPHSAEELAWIVCEELVELLDPWSLAVLLEITTPRHHPVRVVKTYWAHGGPQDVRKEVQEGYAETIAEQLSFLSKEDVPDAVPTE